MASISDAGKFALGVGFLRNFLTRKDRAMKREYLEAQIGSLKADAKAAEQKIKIQQMALEQFGFDPFADDAPQRPALQDFTGGGAVADGSWLTEPPPSIPLPRAIAQSRTNQIRPKLDPNAMLKGEIQLQENRTQVEGDMSVTRGPFGNVVSQTPVTRTRQTTEKAEGGVSIKDGNGDPVEQILLPIERLFWDEKGNQVRKLEYLNSTDLPIRNEAVIRQLVNSQPNLYTYSGPPIPGIRTQQGTGQIVKRGAANMVIPNPAEYINDQGMTLTEFGKITNISPNEMTKGDATKWGFHEAGELDRIATGTYVDDKGEVVLGATNRDVYGGKVRPANQSQIARSKVIPNNEVTLWRDSAGNKVKPGTMMGVAVDGGFNYYHKDAAKNADQIQSDITPALYDMYAEGMAIIREYGTGQKLTDAVKFAAAENLGGLSKEQKELTGRVKGYNDLQRAVTSSFARSVGGESGVLTDQDRIYAQNFFIILGGRSQDTLESATKKMSNIVNHMNGKTSAKNMPWLKLRTFQQLEQLKWHGADQYEVTTDDGATWIKQIDNAAEFNTFINLAKAIGVTAIEGVPIK
jgi:hypothetical protein